MKKIIIITIFFSSVSFSQYPHFETGFIFTDEFNNSQELILGYDPFGTDSLDPQLGEVVVPQVPPGQFGVRFQIPTDTSIYTVKDIRFGCGQPFYYEHLIDLSYTASSLIINIDWQWGFELWMISIIDPFTGQNLVTLESFYDSSYYSIPESMEKIILGIEYNGPLSWPEYGVTSPNGGETLIGGEFYTITWWSNGIFPPARLEYSTDSGTNWELISDSLWFAPNSYEWLVPYLNSNNCLVRIGDYPCAYDQSYGYFTITYPVSVENETELPEEFSLPQNYPNPFNPTTKIKYIIPASPKSSPKERTFITLKVFDILGIEIATLVNEEKPPGEYEVEFNGHSDEGQNLSSGVYFYQLRFTDPETSLPDRKPGSGQGFVQTRKMILIR